MTQDELGDIIIEIIEDVTNSGLLLIGDKPIDYLNTSNRGIADSIIAALRLKGVIKIEQTVKLH